jgi:pimeloyl-ACP methyl ester carboxylesterase/DNA-binding CsgD family transcriptional regulator
MLRGIDTTWDRIYPVGMPTIHYAQSGDIRIAYQVVGNGPIDLVFVPGYISNLEVHWEDPGYIHLIRRLSAFTRLIMFDKRGTGLSDRVDTSALPSLETRMDDVRAVMDAAGSGRAALLGASEGAPMAALFAATYPSRTRTLVLYGAYAHFLSSVMNREALEKFLLGIENSWGTGASLVNFAPGRVDDAHFCSWWARFERLSATPTAARALARMNAQIDVRKILPTIRVPTLVVHRAADARVKISGGRDVAAKIAGARFVEIPGRDHPIWTGDTDRVVDEIEEFLTGTKTALVDHRFLANIVVARMSAPAESAARLGDRHWGERTDHLRRQAIEAIARYGGIPIGINVSEITARFDGPARAVRYGHELCALAHSLAFELAVGVHTGEIEIREGSVSGLALHVTERIATSALPGEVLASGVVHDLVAGSGLHFGEHDRIEISGLDEPVRLFAATSEQHLQPIMPTPRAPRLDILSPREREVLVLVAEGLSNAGIAARLQLSNHTVKRHVANILLKLDLPTRAAAAAFASRQSSA